MNYKNITDVCDALGFQIEARRRRFCDYRLSFPDGTKGLISVANKYPDSFRLKTSDGTVRCGYVDDFIKLLAEEGVEVPTFESFLDKRREMLTPLDVLDLPVRDKLVKLEISDPCLESLLKELSFRGISMDILRDYTYFAMVKDPHTNQPCPNLILGFDDGCHMAFNGRYWRPVDQKVCVCQIGKPMKHQKVVVVEGPMDCLAILQHLRKHGRDRITLNFNRIVVANGRVKCYGENPAPHLKQLVALIQADFSTEAYNCYLPKESTTYRLIMDPKKSIPVLDKSAWFEPFKSPADKIMLRDEHVLKLMDILEKAREEEARQLMRQAEIQKGKEVQSTTRRRGFGI